MVRRPERRLGEKRCVQRQQAADTENFAYFNGFLPGQGRQNRWQPSGQHGFSAAGRANEQEIMTACGSNFYCPFGVFLAFDFSKIKVKFAAPVPQTGKIKFNRPRSWLVT